MPRLVAIRNTLRYLYASGAFPEPGQEEALMDAMRKLLIIIARPPR